MRRTVALVLVGVALALGAAACGGGGNETFDAEGIGITFEHPSDFDRLEKIRFGRQAGAQAAARAGVGLDVDNAIIVSRYDLQATVTAGNLATFKAEVDRVIGQLAGKPVSGRRITYGSLPGYEYEVSLDDPPGATSRLALLFDRRTEYLVNCQSTPEKRDQIEEACRQALDTLEKK